MTTSNRISKPNINLCNARQQPILNAVQNVKVLGNLQILGLGLEHLVRVLTGAEHVRLSAWIHLAHLLRQLACGCHVSGQ